MPPYQIWHDEAPSFSELRRHLVCPSASLTTALLRLCWECVLCLNHFVLIDICVDCFFCEIQDQRIFHTLVLQRRVSNILERRQMGVSKPGGVRTFSGKEIPDKIGKIREKRERTKKDGQKGRTNPDRGSPSFEPPLYRPFTFIMGTLWSDRECPRKFESKTV